MEPAKRLGQILVWTQKKESANDDDASSYAFHYLVEFMKHSTSADSVQLAQIFTLRDAENLLIRLSYKDPSINPQIERRIRTFKRLYDNLYEDMIQT